VTDAAEIFAANARFAESFVQGELPRAPRRRVAIVTCMDARMDPLALLGLELGDANVLRNAGGVVTDDVLRSLAISHAILGTREAIVVGHTECGLHSATNDEIHAALGSPAGVGLDFLPFADLDKTVRASVRRIEASPLLPSAFAARGYVYDVRSGRLSTVWL
jgi:carbonic anhydrase